ncbi:MAG TPA: NAD(P)/FAD-dependent oxidoreductase [Bryobacteraceae bacterium]|nr:NAD(P)/FAD-dependent oxidoreductase [Bryobacteraceae bacterium]
MLQNSPHRVFDVAVIGGGPAGSTAARLLASWGYSVVLVAREARAHQRAETLPPSIRRLFRLLDIYTAVQAAGFYQTSGNVVRWGTEAARTEDYPEEHGYQVKRDEFDSLLLGLASAPVLRDAVRHVEFSDVAEIHLRSGTTLQARFVIDASGRAGVVARQGIRVSEPGRRTIAICGYWTSPSALSSHTVVESSREGWVWSIPVAATRRFVTVMVDAGAIRGKGVAATYTAMTRGEGGHLIGVPWACDASMYHANSYAGEHFLLAGDAGSFVDPLSSYGVKKAMSSGWLAAIVVNTALRNPAMSSVARGYFTARERQVYESQLRQTAAHFRSAGLWADQPNDIESFYTNSELSNAFEELKRAPRIQLRRAENVHKAALPRICGNEIVLAEGLAAPGLPAEVEYVHGVHLWKLAEMAEGFGDVSDLYAAYNRACVPVALPNFLSALSVLVAKNVLRNEGARCSR